jgi:putative CocE/NonD family hydrolase
LKVRTSPASGDGCQRAQGIDYVNGYFGPQARIDRRELQLRWMDHYLKGVDNDVDKEPGLDIFVIGDNTWRKEREWPLARTDWTNFYLRQDGKLETTAPGNEPPDKYTYDPGNPTPFLVNSRELELEPQRRLSNGGQRAEGSLDLYDGAAREGY